MKIENIKFDKIITLEQVKNKIQNLITKKLSLNITYDPLLAVLLVSITNHKSEHIIGFAISHVCTLADNVNNRKQKLNFDSAKSLLNSFN